MSRAGRRADRSHRDGRARPREDGPREDGPLVAGKYRVVSRLGSGGSATVSLAVSQGIAGFSKLVVLKAIRETTRPGSRAVDGFLDEARLSARLNHPNVVQVYEVVEHEGLPVIVMEYLDGQPLASLMAEAYGLSEFTPEARLTIVTKVLAGLHHAHELCDFSGRPLGLVHRDVSPHNVMVTYDGQVKLVDFGIAQLGVGPREPRSQRVPGKLAYMAPEQLLGAADRRADVFAAGILLWELTTLRRFWGSASEAAVMRRLLAFDVPHRRTLRPEMDEELAAIGARALAADPAARYPSAAEMQADLERFLLARSGVVVESALGQLVQRAFGAGRAHSQQAVRALLAGLDAPLLQSRSDALPDDGPSPAEEALATVATCAPLPSAPAWRSRSAVALLVAAVLGHAGDTRLPEAIDARRGLEPEQALLPVHPIERAAPLERSSPAPAQPGPELDGEAVPRRTPASVAELGAKPASSRAALEPVPSGTSGALRPVASNTQQQRRAPAPRRRAEAARELEPGADLRPLRRSPASDGHWSGGWR